MECERAPTISKPWWRLTPPTFFALQETKVADEEFPGEALIKLGFPHVLQHGQKGHYGVALASRCPLLDVERGIPWRPEEQQRRFITAKLSVNDSSLKIINAYFPQGGNRDHPTKFSAKAEFYRDLRQYLDDHCSPTENVLLCGDMNVAPEDKDIGIGEDNRKRWLKTGKAGFLPEEREWLNELYEWGLTDTFNQPEEESTRRYSWFDYRSRGFERSPRRGLRIDLILATQPMQGILNGSGVDYDIRASDKPSDHCPVWAEFSL